MPKIESILLVLQSPQQKQLLVGFLQPDTSSSSPTVLPSEHFKAYYRVGTADPGTFGLLLFQEATYIPIAKVRQSFEV